MLEIGVTGMSMHSLTSEFGIVSRSHDLVGEEFRILMMSPSDSRANICVTNMSKNKCSPVTSS